MFGLSPLHPTAGWWQRCGGKPERSPVKPGSSTSFPHDLLLRVFRQLQTFGAGVFQFRLDALPFDLGFGASAAESRSWS